jgi:hypothetical protein
VYSPTIVTSDEVSVQYGFGWVIASRCTSSASGSSRGSGEQKFSTNAANEASTPASSGSPSWFPGMARIGAPYPAHGS